MNLNGSSRSHSSFRMLAVALVFVAAGTIARGQDSGEVQKLKERIEQLEKDLKSSKSLNDSLERQVERLEKHVEQLEAKLPDSEKESTKKPTLTELLTVGTILQGDLLVKSSKDKAMENSYNFKMTITISEKNGQKFKGGSVAVHPDGNKFEADVEGKIDGKLVVIQRVNTAKKMNMKLTLKGDGVDGRWESAVGDSGTVAFKLK
jgi:predicted RNase H-like nuclease (RuvC/YqgF family)